MPPSIGPLVGWLHFAALVVALGSVSTLALVLGRSGREEIGYDPWMRERVTRIGARAAMVLTLAMALVFLRQMAEFRDPFVAWSEDASLLVGSTGWGRAWLVGCSAAALAALGLSLATDGKGPWFWLGALAVMVAGAFPAWTGHANSAGGLRPLTLAADAAHVWAAGAWLGGLTVVLLTERAWWRAGRGAPGLLPALVPAFSRVAVAGVATLALTGVFAAWVHIEGPAELVTTAYGRLLVAKLVLVAAVMLLGMVNWKRLTPTLGEIDGPQRLRRAATAELLIGQLVLLVTALLVHTSPLEP